MTTPPAIFASSAAPVPSRRFPRLLPRPAALQLLDGPLDAEAEAAHPTIDERTLVRLAHLRSSRNTLKNARKSYDFWGFSCAVVTVPTGMLSFVLLLNASSYSTAALLGGSLTLLAFLWVMSRRFLRLRDELGNLLGCLEYKPWTARLADCCVRLRKRGVALPQSLEALLPFLGDGAEERTLLACGQADTLAMIRLVAVMRRVADTEVLPVLSLGGETEELVGRVGDALGAHASRARPGEVVL